jgi:hypothetical protein
VCEAEDEFVNDAINADGARYKREGSIRWVGVDEVVGVKGCEAVFAYAATVLVSACNSKSLEEDIYGKSYVIVGIWFT